MRIAQVAPLLTNIPPIHLGPGLIIAFLVEELIRQGHDVTLFATADSHTSARLVPSSDSPVNYGWPAWVHAHMLMVEQVYKQAKAFDIIHTHIECFALPLARLHRTPTFSTLHVPLSPQDWYFPIYQEYHELPLIAVSDFHQSATKLALNWQKTIHYGLPADTYPFQPISENYLAYIHQDGSFESITMALSIASYTGMKLKIAFPERWVSASQTKEIETLPDTPLVEYLRDLNDIQMCECISKASALIVPASKNEPFNFNALQALAYGTPILVSNEGSLPELVEQGVNGFIYRTINDAIHFVNKIPSISRNDVRETFERSFTVQNMANEHINLYNQYTDL